MSGFRPATERELKALRTLTAAQRTLRRLEIRLAIRRARIRVARTLKAARPMRTITDVRWHAELTAREAHALGSLARILKAQRVFGKAVSRLAAALKA